MSGNGATTRYPPEFQPAPLFKPENEKYKNQILDAQGTYLALLKRAEASCNALIRSPTLKNSAKNRQSGLNNAADIEKTYRDDLAKASEREGFKIFELPIYAKTKTAVAAYTDKLFARCRAQSSALEEMRIDAAIFASLLQSPRDVGSFQTF